MFFKKQQPGDDNLKQVTELLHDVRAFISANEVYSIKQYIIGPIDISNYFKVKNLLLQNKPLTTFEISSGDYYTVYIVSAKSAVSLIFAKIYSPNYETKTGFFSVFDGDISNSYLEALNFATVFEDGFVKVPGSEIVNKEYQTIKSMPLTK